MAATTPASPTDTEADTWAVDFTAFDQPTEYSPSEGIWTSQWHEPGFAFKVLVPSWRVDTPPGNWVEVAVQVRTATTESGWFPAGTWAFHDEINRASIKEHKDGVGVFAVDTFTAHDDAPGGLPVAYRLRANVHGCSGLMPAVGQLAASTATPGELPPSPSKPIKQEHRELTMAGFSQSTHRGEYAQFGGGGQVWCSPTSVAMVMRYWGIGPTDDELAQLPPDDVFDAHARHDPQVPWAALHSWDYSYRGTGNWSFSTAYAAHYGLDGSVRHYSSLRDIERWIDDQVPVIVSIRWDNDSDEPLHNLDGASVEHSNGHLLVVAGFTSDGDVIAVDPAAPDNDQVRRVYRRDQFEHNWLRGSHGVTYIIKPLAIGVRDGQDST